jgi:molybdopterin-guanine dinucleotide biosynthesis protein A
MKPVTNLSIAAAILAGGRASRYGGRDKSRLVVGDRPIIVRQIEVLERMASPVIVIANDAVRFADLHVPVHGDVVPDAGALGGIYTAVSTSGADLVMVVACDMPFLEEALLRRLVQLAAGADGAWVHTARGPEPLLACYQRHAAPIIRRELDAGRLRAGDLSSVLNMAEIDEVELARFGPAEKLLLNVNSPEDWGRAARYFAEAT